MRLLPRKLPLGGRTTAGDLTGHCRTGNTKEESRVALNLNFEKLYSLTCMPVIISLEIYSRLINSAFHYYQFSFAYSIA